MAKSRRNFRLFVAASLMAAGLLLIAFAAEPWHERMVTDYWQERIDGLPDAELRGVFAELTQRGDLGIRILASQVGAERAAVSRAAYQALRDTIRGWREDALSKPLPELRLIAQVLAGSLDRAGPAARERAAALARQILLWMPPGTDSDRHQLIAHCQTVFQLSGDNAEQLLTTADDWPQLREPLPAATDRFRGEVHLPLTALGTDRQIALAHHGATLRDEQAAFAEPPEPEPLTWPETPDKSPSTAAGRDRTVATDASRAAAAAESSPAPRILTELPAAQPLPHRVSSGPSTGDAIPVADPPRGTAETVPPQGDLTRLPVIDLMRLLHASSADTVAAATDELYQRGLRGKQIELASDLTDPDPAVRRRLVDQLPAAAGPNARPWLLWLSHDDDADVRLAALNFLATSTDPQLLEHVRQIADRDQDPRIEALGTRLQERQAFLSRP